MATYQDPRKKVVMVKYNGVPTTTEAIKLSENVLFKPNVKTTTRPTIGTGQVIYETDAPKDATVKTTIKSDVRTPSAVGSLPSINDLFRMSGMTPAVGADPVTVTYSPTTPTALGQVIDYTDDEKRVITGVIANFSMEFVQGEACTISFDVNGKMDVSPVAEANPTGIVLDSGRKFFVDCISVISFDGGGNQLQESDIQPWVHDCGEQCKAECRGGQYVRSVQSDRDETDRSDRGRQRKRSRSALG